MSKLVRPGLGIRKSRLGRFLHYLAELSGKQQLAFALCFQGLDKQNVAADRRPGEAGHDTDLVSF